jgi:hypothetical protein
MFEKVIFVFIILFLIVLALDISAQEKSIAALSAEVSACKLGVLDAKKPARK